MSLLIIELGKDIKDFNGNNPLLLQRSPSVISAEETRVFIVLLPHFQMLFLWQNNPKETFSGIAHNSETTV